MSFEKVDEPALKIGIHREFLFEALRRSHLPVGQDSPPASHFHSGGMVALTHYLARRFGGQRIRVNCVSPGGLYLGDVTRFRLTSKADTGTPLRWVLCPAR